MIVELIKLANDLDSRGLVKEADVIDALLKTATVGPTHPSQWFTRDEQGNQVPLHDPDSPEYARLAASYDESISVIREPGAIREPGLPASFMQELDQLTPEQKEAIIKNPELIKQREQIEKDEEELEKSLDKALDMDF